MASSVENSIAVLEEIDAQARELGAVLAGNRDDLAEAADAVEEVGSTHLGDVPGLIEEAQSGYSACQDDLGELCKRVAEQRELVCGDGAGVGAGEGGSRSGSGITKDEVLPTNPMVAHPYTDFTAQHFVAGIIKDGATTNDAGRLQSVEGEPTYATETGQHLYYDDGVLYKLEEFGRGNRFMQVIGVGTLGDGTARMAGLFGVDPGRDIRGAPYKAVSEEPAYVTEFDKATGAFVRATVRGLGLIAGKHRYEMTTNRHGVIKIVYWYGELGKKTAFKICGPNPNCKPRFPDPGSPLEKDILSDLGLIGKVAKKAGERSDYTHTELSRQAESFAKTVTVKVAGTSLALGAAVGAPPLALAAAGVGMAALR